MDIIKIILFVAAVLFLEACAVQKDPLGGPKDEDPPVLDSIKSTANYQVNFDEEVITLRFDEFIQLKNQFTQIVYSPPLKKKPEIKQRGKKIKIDFSDADTLKANTTYTINFGEAIQDLNEGNIMDNFRFVFSTGPVIDSLEFGGIVTDDMTGEPAAEVLVMLYETFEDSIVYKEQPFYFSKTDEQGRFRFQNLRSDTFMLTIVKDENLNLKYDDGEFIGYLDTLVFVTDSMPSFSLFGFVPEPDVLITDDESLPFQYVLEFNRDPYDVTISGFSDEEWCTEERTENKIILWHSNNIDKDSFIVSSADQILDTLYFDKEEVEDQDSIFNIRLENVSNKGVFPAGVNVELSMPYPIIDIDTSKIYILDTISTRPFTLHSDSSLLRSLEVSAGFRYGDTLDIEILPGAFILLDGSTNDTLYREIIPDNPENYGNINITIDSLKTEENYIVELYDKDNLVESYRIQQKSTDTRNFAYMQPKQYNVKIILDSNNNGRWDPGDYFEKRKSEAWKIYNMEALRANWDLEVKFVWKEE